MLRKIYFELVEIRKELQAIRRRLEPNPDITFERVDGHVRAINKCP